MLENDNGTLRAVAWTEVCPWLNLVRAFRMAISFRVLPLAAVAVLLMLCGWAMFGHVFSIDAEAEPWMQPQGGSPWLAIDTAVADRPEMPKVPNVADGDRLALAPTAWTAFDPLLGTWAHLSRPLWAALVSPEAKPSYLACLLLCGLWSLAIWAFFGGAISRMTAVQLACDERVGWAAAMRYACSKWASYFAGPLFPLIGVLLAALPAFVLGLLIWAGGFGVLLAALLWPLVLLAGLVMATLLLGLVFGWPLMWGTISTEGTDCYDALGRCYAYVFRRPLHYLFYAIVAALIGALGWLLVRSFAAGVIGLTYGAAGWLAGGDQIGAILEGSDSLGPVGGVGAALIRLCAGCVKLLAVGYVYGYFWTASTAIYLLLRRDVDATEMDEVFLDEDASEESYGLPPLGTDEAGAPIANDDIPEVEPEDDPEDDPEPSEDPREEDPREEER
ncbi:MAG: hypothetical protein JXB62_14870 [Pirellulales bacterium]|nr:hypothetical protein [Pirellulales bacterium]